MNKAAPGFSDEQLAKARAGDAAALESLIRAHESSVYSLALRMLGTPELAEDLTQDVFMQLNGNLRTMGSNTHLMFWLRKRYYSLVESLSSIETIQDFTGFGLYDRKVVDLVRSFDDPYPYFRGMIAEIGLPTVKLVYDQPARKFGITKNNWYTLYDIGMLGIINNSKVPLRLAGPRSSCASS